MKIIADEIKMPTVPVGIATNEEILLFLQKKVVEKYPQGGVKARKHIVNTGLSKRLLGEMDMQYLYVRTTSSLPAKLGYGTVYCDVIITRDGEKMEIEIQADPNFGEDAVKHVLSYFNVRKRDALVADVKGWLSFFLESKQNPSLSPLQANTPQESGQESSADGLSRRCGACGAEIPSGEPVCPYCGSGSSDNTEPTAAPDTSVQLADAQPLAAQEPAKRKNTYVLLGVLLGGLGIHNFYAGYKSKAIAQLLITVLTGGYGSMVSWIWAIIEICTVKQDANGTPFA